MTSGQAWLLIIQVGFLNALLAAFGIIALTRALRRPK